MTARIMASSVAIAVACGVVGCTKHERMDPTGATKQILYEKPPAAAAPATAPAAVPPAPSTPAPRPATTATLDVVELVSGERIEGKVREVGTATVLVEVAGQSITIDRQRVRTIRIGQGGP